MRSNGILKKSTYILLSVGIAVVIVFTALPYYCLTSLAFPGWNIYWDYYEVQKNMMILFPLLSFIGAFTTIKKKNNIEDILLNIAFPLTILLILKVMQYHFILTIIIIMITVLFAIDKVIDFIYSRRCPANKYKRIRMIYYICRRKVIYPLLFIMAPMAVWVNYQESSESARIIFEATMEENSEIETAPLEPKIVSALQWIDLEVESRYEMIREFTYYECNKLGVLLDNVYGVKELANGALAYYSDNENAVYYNIFYLKECSLEEALHVACHEVHHKYSHALIDTLMALEDAGVDYESLGYFDEAIEIKRASDNYYLDSLDYSRYSQNLLEVKAEEYAECELMELRELGYLRME